MESVCLAVSSKSYQHFKGQAKDVLRDSHSLKVFCETSIREKLFSIAQDTFSREITEIKIRLEDPSLGISAIDLMDFEDSANPASRVFWSGVAAISLSGAIMTPEHDLVNDTPFSIYNSSVPNEIALRKVGLAFNSPAEKLGFHSDGLLKSNGIYVPHHLMLYNLLLAYDNPGSFHWVPVSSWNDREYWADRIGVNKIYRFRPSPIAYGNGAEGTMNIVHDNEIEAPIFWESSAARTIFLNGMVIGNDEVQKMVQSMKDSLLNSRRISVPQKIGRAIFLKNSSGFHARDIFEGPLLSAKYTRSMIRSMNKEGFCIVSHRDQSDKKTACI